MYRSNLLKKNKTKTKPNIKKKSKYKINIKKISFCLNREDQSSFAGIVLVGGLADVHKLFIWYIVCMIFF